LLFTSAFLLWLCITFQNQLEPELLYPIGVAWIGFSVVFVFSVLGKRLGWSKKLIGCLILTAGLGNTSFGFPIIEALYMKKV
jgi:hypothetical protein